MKIRILTIGKLKEKYLVNGINEYVKRLNAYCKVEMVEVSDEPIPDNASENVENTENNENNNERKFHKI